MSLLLRSLPLYHFDARPVEVRQWKEGGGEGEGPLAEPFEYLQSAQGGPGG